MSATPAPAVLPAGGQSEGASDATASTSAANTTLTAGGETSKQSLNQVLDNLPQLFGMEAQGTLSVIQQSQLRSLLATQTRAAILRAAARGLPNPLVDIPDKLNPINSWQHGPAITTKAKFEADIDAALVTLKTLGTTIADRHTLPGGPQQSPIISQHQPKIQVPAGLMALDEVKKWIKGTAQERQAKMDADPIFKKKFNEAVAYWTGRNNSTRPTSAGGPSTAQSAGNTNPASHAASLPGKTEFGLPAPPYAMLGAMMTANQAFPDRQTLLRGPPPRPVESEDARRHRKFNQYLHEQAPGMELEMGTLDVFGAVADTFLEEVAKGGMRLAKHRKSDKVEVKDVAFYLDKTYGITVPGFNISVPERTHVQTDAERKRSKGVVPKAGRLRDQAANDV